METAILPNRSILVMDGPDTLSLLERLVTNNTHDWDVGEARYGALLTPQGKVIADFIAHRTETGALLDTATNAVGDLAKRLKMFRLRAKVEIEVDGNKAAAITEDGAPDPRSEAMPKRGVVEAGAAPELSQEDWDAIRIPAGIPEWGADFGAADVFPWEINMDRYGAVDLKKGCFIGQEVVSRMHRRGKLRKRSVVLEGENIEPGQEVMAGGSIGEVTSACPTHALARLRTDRLAKALEAGESLSVADQSVHLIETGWLKEELAASLSDAGAD
ncbi:CAF17-like 4Fe-4S cluster assembly/insertion protein YgfZ [Henriciella aquimarina]|uniref:CAF17-like 4Fe-4S cluster assembly/insertion protein YgfZ n=1 Tax=Henriciella aquimarina TaxID=545261 RepID=UPI0009FD7BDC|nr:folate-binding protein YgfZ [Henriciella aquimarina]